MAELFLAQTRTPALGDEDLREGVGDGRHSGYVSTLRRAVYGVDSGECIRGRARLHRRK